MGHCSNVSDVIVATTAPQTQREATQSFEKEIETFCNLNHDGNNTLNKADNASETSNNIFC